MDTPGAFYAVALHTPELRDALVREAAHRRPRRPWGLGPALRRGVAQALRAVAARLDPQPAARHLGDPRLAVAP